MSIDLSFTTRAATALAETIPLDTDVTGVPLTIEFSDRGDFASVRVTKTATGAGKSVALALTATEVDSLKGGHYRIKAGNTVVYAYGAVHYTSAEVVSGNSGGSTGGAVSSVNGKVGVVVLGAGDVGAIPVADAVELAQSTSQTLTGASVTSGLAADAGHTHRLPNIDANGFITLFTANGTPVKLKVANGVVGAGGGAVSTLAAPGDLAVAPSETALALTWDAVTNAASYNVQVYNSAGFLAESDAITGTSTTVSGLTGDTDYSVQVAAVDADGPGPWSAVQTAHTTAPIIVVTPPNSGGGGGGTPTFTDNFARADGPLGGSDGWHAYGQQGNLPVIVGGAAANPPGVNGLRTWAVRPDLVGDGTVTATLSGDSTGSGTALVFRATPDDVNNRESNWLFFNADGNFYSVVGGTYTVLATVDDGLSGHGQVTAVISGDTITITVHRTDNSTGHLSVTTTDPAGAPHNVGFSCAATNDRVDDFSFTPAGAAPAPAPAPAAFTANFAAEPDGTALDNSWLFGKGRPDQVFEVHGGALYPMTYEFTDDIRLRDLGSADGDLILSCTGTYPAGIVFRWVDDQNYFYARENGVYRVQAGSGTRIIDNYGSLGNRFHIRLSGSTIELYGGDATLGDGTLAGTVTDSLNQTATQHGFLTVSKETGVVSFEFTLPAVAS